MSHSLDAPFNDFEIYSVCTFNQVGNLAEASKLTLFCRFSTPWKKKKRKREAGAKVERWVLY